VSGPSLLHADWLGGLGAAWLLLAAGVGASIWRARRRARRLGQLGAGGPGPSGVGADAIRLVALLAVGVALLGPRIGTRDERLATSGVDAVVLLDVSRSMDARDLPPSRLDRARRAAAGLLAGLAPGDRAALAAFAGRGVLLTPLTHDHAALAELLPALDTDLVTPASSRLGAGVRAALGAFEAESERPRVLVVLSDGEDADGVADLGLAEAERAGARVVAVALGSAEGAAIPHGGLELRDRHGRVVTTRVDSARLERLARGTGGPLLRPDALGAVDGEALRAAVRRDAPPPGSGPSEVVRRVPAVRVAPFAWIALLLLVVEAGAGARRSAPVLATSLAAALALGVNGGNGPTAGDDARALLARGLALAEAERWEGAERAFRAAALAARDPALAADAYHDAGVAALRGDRLEAARDAFLESLAVSPSDETRFNLEWTLRALAAATPPTPPSATPRPGEADETSEPRPEPVPEAPPEASRSPSSPPPAARPPAAPPPLGEAEAERWLARARDDPGRALRGHGGDPGEPARGSAW
jgi:Ca-activated chloride channel family protein